VARVSSGWIFLGTAVVALGCGTDHGLRPGDVSSRRFADVGGCQCATSGTCDDISYGDIPADGQYYITTFGGGGDTQPMSCGGTADGNWAYIADRARFGCGAKVRVEANGKACITEVADCGPNICVEQAACNCGCGDHFPIIDASPFITEYLFGVSGVGWSDHTLVTAVLADPASTVGCPGDEPWTPQQDAAVPQQDAAVPQQDAAAHLDARPPQQDAPLTPYDAPWPTPDAPLAPSDAPRPLLDGPRGEAAPENPLPDAGDPSGSPATYAELTSACGCRARGAGAAPWAAALLMLVVARLRRRPGR
jgi:hypothetical protein